MCQEITPKKILSQKGNFKLLNRDKKVKGCVNAFWGICIN